MKVFFIDPMSYNNLELYDRSLLNEHNTKFNITFFCNNKLSKKSIDGVNVLRVFSYSDKRILLKGISYILSLLQILFIALKEKPNIIHVQWYRLPAADYIIYRIMKTILKKCAFIHTAHNILPHNHYHKHIRQYKRLYSLNNCIILHTKKSKQELMSLINNKSQQVVIIPHGPLNHETTDNSPLLSLDLLNSKIKHNNKLVFSSLGAQNHYKGIDLLINVWLNTPELYNREDIILIIAGKGVIPKLPIIKKLDNVFVKNEFLTDNEFNRLMDLTDVLLLPYRKISQSGLLLTAINKKKPVLASDIGGLSDPFEHGEIGWLIKPDNYDELKNALIYISQNREKVHSIKNNLEAWKSVLDYYDWTKIRNRTFSLYEQFGNNIREK